MRPLSLTFVVSLAALLAAAPARAEQAILVDNVVALVGDLPILRSEVLAKVRLFQVSQKPKDASELARWEKQVLEAMVDNALIVGDALRLGIQATDLEVAQAKERFARKVGRSHEEVLAEGKRYGFTAEDYDSAIRSEVIEQKWIALVVKPRVKASAAGGAALDDQSPYVRQLVAERSRAVAELRESTFVLVRW
jgi:parvulin-like peptidyl-prolyl isomerase